MDAFDADVLIYAAAPDDPLGRPVRQLFDAATAVVAGETRFITNNTKDFSREIAEIQITDPVDLRSSAQST